MSTILTIYFDTTDPGNTGLAFRHVMVDDDNRHEESGPIDDLGDLLRVLRMGADEVRDENGRHLDELPVFGGTEPDDTIGVWSWDAERLLVGTCPDDFEIVPRATQGVLVTNNTACADCQYLQRETEDPRWLAVWWNLRCAAAPTEHAFNALTGLVDAEQPFVRDVNEGNCNMFCSGEGDQ